MAISVRKIRLVNPFRKLKKRKPQSLKLKRKRNAQARKCRAKKNPAAQLLTLGFTNPTRSSTVKRNKKKTNARRKNPLMFLRAKHRRHNGRPRRRRNPEVMGLGIGQPVDVLKSGAFALVGLVATRQIPQFALKDKNSGFIGYLANGAAAIVSAAALGKVAGKAAAQAALIGGAMYIANRVLSEQLSPIGKYLSLSGIGDANAAGLGDIRESYFPIPVPTTGGQAMQPVLPAAIQRLAAPAPVPAQARTMSGVSAATASRFNSRF